VSAGNRDLPANARASVDPITLHGMVILISRARLHARLATSLGAALGERIGAVVSRGGRPDLADNALEAVRSPTLLIVGGADSGVLELNQYALSRMKGNNALEVVPGATHLFH